MSELHSDSTAIDRIGRAAVMGHFLVTRQAIWKWRKTGVPAGFRKPLRLLGESLGHDMRDFETSVS